MPICAVYAGLSCVSILAVKSPDDKIQLNFPYSYSDYFSGNFKNKKNFVDALIERFFQENNLTTSDFRFASCWCPEIPNLGEAVGLSISLSQLMQESSDTDLCIFVNRYGVLTQNNGSSCASIDTVSNTDLRADLTQDEIEKINSAANSYIFPQIIPNNIFDTLEEDSSVRFVDIEQKDKVVVTGDRFLGRDTSTSHILSFDLIKKPGVYEFKIDTKNMWVLLGLIHKVDEKLGEVLSAGIDFMEGTLVNSPGGAECLVSGDEGSDRLLEIKDNSIFILPLKKGSKVKITVKGNALNTTQKSVWGGDFGLVIDTRPKNNSIRFNELYTQKNLKMWEESVNIHSLGKFI